MAARTSSACGRCVRKERLKSDAEAQTLEDVACLVFLEHYLGDFMAKIDEDKLAGILAKTWNKMSPRGREQALEAGVAAAGAGPARAGAWRDCGREARTGPWRP